MGQEEVSGTLIGTFEGRAGDQFQRAAGKVDVSVADGGYDQQTNEELVEITFRMEQPVDENRIAVTLPEHGVDKLLEELLEQT